MNLFKGLTDQQILSFVLAFGLFNVFVILEAVALASIYLVAKPINGRVRTAAMWHVLAAIWFNFAIVSAVWSAPAEKAFVNGTTLFDFGYDRFQKVLIGMLFTGLGVACMAIGGLQARRQRQGRPAATPAALEARS